EAVGVRPRDAEVDGRAATRRQAAAAARRTDVRKQVETLAQLARRIEAAFGHGGIVVVRDGSKDRAVGRFGGIERRRRERGALRTQRGKTDGYGDEGKAKPEDAVDRAQDRH